MTERSPRGKNFSTELVDNLVDSLLEYTPIARVYWGVSDEIFYYGFCKHSIKAQLLCINS